MWSKILNFFKKITNLVKKAEEVKDKIQEALPQDKQDNVAEAEREVYAELQWMYGGFRGNGAERCEGATIANLSVNNNGLSYEWKAGGCEALGANGAHNASETLACFFCLINGKWVGGKFDWISTSRTTRDFHNIHSGYNGWDSYAIKKAEAYRFVIVSANGARRTNVIEVDK